MVTEQLYQTIGAAHVSGGAASPGCPRCEPVRMRDAVCWNAPGPVKLFDNKQIGGVAPLAQLAEQLTLNQ